MSGTQRGRYGEGSVSPKGRHWQGRFYVDGKQRKVSLGLRRDVDPKGLTEKQARAKLRERQASFKPPNPEGSTPFGAVAERYIARQKLLGEINDRTEYDYRLCLKNHLKPEFGDRGIGDPTPSDVKHFQDRLLEKLSKRSVRIYMSLLSGIFSFAVSEGMREDNPCSSVKRPKRPGGSEIRILFSAELAKVIDAIPSDVLGEVDRRLYPLSAKSGLRQAESTKRFRWRHADFGGRNIRVLGETKSGKSRTIPMAADVKEMLEEWREETIWDKDDDLVFPNPETGKPMSGSTVLKRFQRAVQKAGVGEFELRHRDGKNQMWPLTTFHDLRHSFATSLAMAGVPLPTIQTWMGHSEIQTTMIYAHYVPTEHEADVLDRALGNSVEGLV